MFSIGERSGQRAGQGNNSIWRLTKNLWTMLATCGHCYPVEIWLWPIPEGKEGQLAPLPRRSRAGCLKYRQCVLEECESDIQYHLIPKYPVKDQCVGA
ncbi:hypothetical protein TNCV_2500711 [Trichonephila clavipes]|nr:hypothetical protein TNCV_2500711 [Trichonephila clavipes]